VGEEGAKHVATLLARGDALGDNFLGNAVGSDTVVSKGSRKKEGSDSRNELAKADAVSLRGHEAAEEGRLHDSGKARQDGQEEHHGHGLLGHLDVAMHIGIGLEEAKGTAEGDGGDDIEGEVLGLPGEVHGAKVALGGDVAGIDEPDEGEDLAVDGGLEALDVFARVLREAVISSGSWQMMVDIGAQGQGLMR
jgi:hypothetical protein